MRVGKRLGGLFEAFNLDPGRKKKIIVGGKGGVWISRLNLPTESRYDIVQSDGIYLLFVENI